VTRTEGYQAYCKSSTSRVNYFKTIPEKSNFLLLLSSFKLLMICLGLKYS
jgi:hypothetical protein